MGTGRWKQLISTFNNSNVNLAKKILANSAFSINLHMHLDLNINPSELRQIPL